MDPVISIIVPVYNVEQYFNTCVQSVINQSYSNWELILVDDGSPDHCPEMCDKFASIDKRIKVIHKNNGGLSSARNAALKVFKGDYVTFLDSDDFWHHDYLKILIEACLKNDAQISQCNFVRGSETIFPNISVNPIYKCYSNHTIFTQLAAKIVVWGKLYKRDILEGIEMPVGLINEDDWTTWKLYYRAQRIVITNLHLYYYTVNPNSIMSSQKKHIDFSYLNAYEERIAFFKLNKEEDLEHMSHFQLCKSLLLTYGKYTLTNEDRMMVKIRFNKSWEIIKNSIFIPKTYKLIFFMFDLMPRTISRLARSFK